jgi:hypothetical protein
MKSFVIFLLFLTAHCSMSQYMKGFDLSNATIPIKEIKDGGPPKDGIPSIDHPEFEKASEVEIEENARILGVKYNGVAKAYPLNIMNYHEIVNDMFNGHPVVVTYCPLCGSGIAFDASIDQERRTFGVSGLLYNSDVLLYDRKTESLWSQIMMKAVSGPLAGEKLKMLPTINTTWGQWKAMNPDTKVLTENTGYQRDYTRNPYAGYEESAHIYFDVENRDNRFHPKEMVMGIEVDGKFKAYPFSELEKLRDGKLKDTFNGRDLLIEFNDKSQSAFIKNKKGNLLPSLTTFWFAWYAFHPETEVFYLNSQE